MKLTILKEKLKEGLKLCEKITQKTFALPILQTSLFSTEKNFLKLSSTNLETGINWWGLAKIEEEGKVCLPTKILAQYVDNLPTKPINLSLTKTLLEIKCENYKGEFVGINPEEFPIIPQPQNLEPIYLFSKNLCQNLSLLYKIPSPSPSRPEISGILVEIQDNLIKMVATDSFRLLEKKIYINSPFTQKGNFILPQISAREIISIFGEEENELRLYMSSNQIWLEVLSLETNYPKIQYTSRLIEGEYPKYEEIIPKKFGATIRFQKEEFVNHIRTASLFGGKSNEVILKVDPKAGTVRILSESPNLGKYESSINAEIKGKEMEIAFNWRFLLEGVQDLKSKDILFSLSSQEGPAMITIPDLEDYLYLLMPIKKI